jgi:hypothetical protein
VLGVEIKGGVENGSIFVEIEKGLHLCKPFKKLTINHLINFACWRMRNVSTNTTWLILHASACEMYQPIPPS